MVIVNRSDALALINRGEQDFKFPVELFFFTKIQLYLTAKATKGIELFGIGPQEIRALGFLVEYHDLINNAVDNCYRVFVVKDGTYFGSSDWYLEFLAS